jgi:DNA-binding transcriptional MerR regulator
MYNNYKAYSNWKVNLKISELAKATNVTAKTIRYYEQVNLLLPAKRSESGYRHYDKKDIATLVFIRRCRELNIPIINIKRLLDVQNNPNDSCAFIDEMIQNQLIRIQEAQKELAMLEKSLASLASSCNNHTVEGCSILHQLQSP